MAQRRPLSPILAPNFSPTEESLRDKYPLLVSRKMDGIRCVMCPTGGRDERTVELRSRSWKVIPNVRLRGYFNHLIDFCDHFDYVLDGEIWSTELTFQELMSVCMSRDKVVPDSIRYWIFDGMTYSEWWHDGEDGFETRYQDVVSKFDGKPQLKGNGNLVTQFPANTWSEIQKWYEHALSCHGEGIVIRSSYLCPYLEAKTTGASRVLSFVT